MPSEELATLHSDAAGPAASPLHTRPLDHRRRLQGNLAGPSRVLPSVGEHRPPRRQVQLPPHAYKSSCRRLRETTSGTRPAAPAAPAGPEPRGMRAHQQAGRSRKRWWCGRRCGGSVGAVCWACMLGERPLSAGGREQLVVRRKPPCVKQLRQRDED